MTTLQELKSDLSHTDPQVRRNAAFALGDLGDSRAVRPLTKAYYAHEMRGDYVLYDEPDDVRLAIAMALFCLGETEELADVFSSESGHLRASMVKAMRQLDVERVVKVLVAALSVRKHALSYWATRALGDLRDRRALEPLIEVLQQRRLEERIAAADSLGDLGDERAIPALEQAREKDREEKNWMGRTVSQAATLAIDEIWRSKGLAPRYAARDSRHVEWVGGRIQYEAELFVAEMRAKQGVTLTHDENSVAWLEEYITTLQPDISPEERETVVRDFGTFFGECIRHCYRGKWEPRDGRWAIVFDNQNAVYPFTQVSQFLDDRTDSILSMFRLIPNWLAQQKIDGS